MPLYDFFCVSCKHHFEAMQSAGALVMPPCPMCKEGQVAKAVSAIGGYQMRGSTGGSTRPRHSGSFKKGKKT